MDNLKQVEILKEVLELEAYIDGNQCELKVLKSEKYVDAPKPPVCEAITRVYPEIKSQIKFNWKIACIPAVVIGVLMFAFWWLVLLFFPALFWIPIYYFVIHRQKKKEDIEKIKNSEEYKMQCAKIDEEFNRQQEAANIKYANEKQIYEGETLPQYQRDLAVWTEKHKQKIRQCEQDLKEAQDKLSSIYESTKIVPVQYRKIEILQYLYDIISTSNYDITYAIDNYDKYQQRILDEERLYEQQLANQLANEQAQLLYEQNQISEKARRDANVASVVSTVQRHNTNKALKDLKK